MRPSSFVRVVPLALAGACTNACAISRALYVAVVHNSGAPPRAELARMKEREQVMRQNLAQSRMVRLPVAILGPHFDQPNEAVILWSRFGALSDSVRAHPRADADYVMQVDVLGSRDRIVAVHVMVVDATGTMIYARLWNSHQEMYQRFKPNSLDDVAAMVAADLGRR